MDVIQNLNLVPPLIIRPVKYYDCIEACFESASSSWICADACLNETEISELKTCIELCLTTAEVCAATARMLTSGEDYPYEMTMKQLQSCILASHETAEECMKFADYHEHCLISARTAEECYRACMNCVQELEAL